MFPYIEFTFTPFQICAIQLASKNKPVKREPLITLDFNFIY